MILTVGVTRKEELEDPSLRELEPISITSRPVDRWYRWTLILQQREIEGPPRRV
jgi:hypothetical protein